MKTGDDSSPSDASCTDDSCRKLHHDKYIQKKEKVKDNDRKDGSETSHLFSAKVVPKKVFSLVKSFPKGNDSKITSHPLVIIRVGHHQIMLGICKGFPAASYFFSGKTVR